MMSIIPIPPRSRLLDLARVSCSLFSTTFNPTGARTGNKVLRQRLRGPTVLDYYPKKYATIQDLKKNFQDRHFVDVDEMVRLENVQMAKLRGKGAPKKKRTKTETRRGGGGKK